MAIPHGIRYYGGGDVGGYGQAALANVRLFVNAGLAVHWSPLEWTRGGMRPSRWLAPDGRMQALLGPNGAGEATRDAAALIALTSKPIPCDTVIAHAPPEQWATMFEAGRHNIGCLAWETDRPPAHWPPLMQSADRIVVPSENNREVFRHARLRCPIHVVPHVRRHVWSEYSPCDLSDARADLGIPAQHTVFYCINAWDPRKAMPQLIDAFVRAFSADDPVTLLIKTNPAGFGAGPLHPEHDTRELAAQAVADALAGRGRAPPHICVHNEAIDGAGIDLIHALGDVYVSLSHGEGWGLGAFEAATRATPVVMTGWGGQLDFLGADWPGKVPCRLEAAALWPPYMPSYYPSQRWAVADTDAAAAVLRTHLHDRAAAHIAAQDIRERIVQRFGEARVYHDWMAALDA